MRRAYLEFNRLQKSWAQRTSTLGLESWELSLTDPSKARQVLDSAPEAPTLFRCRQPLIVPILLRPQTFALCSSFYSTEFGCRLFRSAAVAVFTSRASGWRACYGTKVGTWSDLLLRRWH